MFSIEKAIAIAAISVCLVFGAALYYETKQAAIKAQVLALCVQVHSPNDCASLFRK